MLDSLSLSSLLYGCCVLLFVHGIFLARAHFIPSSVSESLSDGDNDFVIVAPNIPNVYPYTFKMRTKREKDSSVTRQEYQALRDC